MDIFKTSGSRLRNWLRANSWTLRGLEINCLKAYCCCSRVSLENCSRNFCWSLMDNLFSNASMLVLASLVFSSAVCGLINRSCKLVNCPVFVILGVALIKEPLCPSLSTSLLIGREGLADFSWKLSANFNFGDETSSGFLLLTNESDSELKGKYPRDLQEINGWQEPERTIFPCYLRYFSSFQASFCLLVRNNVSSWSTDRCPSKVSLSVAFREIVNRSRFCPKHGAIETRNKRIFEIVIFFLSVNHHISLSWLTITIELRCYKSLVLVLLCVVVL